jgi:hypothetical protein
MFVVELVDQLLDIELLAQASIKLAHANLDGRPKLVESRDALKQLAAELLLCGLRQGSRLHHRQFQGLNHIR